MFGAKTCLFLVGVIVGVTQGLDFCKVDIPTWQCANQKECILETYRCDGERDCKDGSDEKACDTDHRCNIRAEIDCGDNTCRPLSYRCDGEENCDDGRDEKGCPASMDLKCDDGEIVPDMFPFRCDGYSDCGDESDEDKKACKAYKCHPTMQLDCGDGQCFPIFYQCDGGADCKDGRDEDDCDV